jgi:hypothetical protein
MFSSEPTRKIINDPTVIGMEYTDGLRESLNLCLKVYRSYLPIKLKESDVNVVNFLRGGLNFGLREALSSAYKFNLHGTSFLSSQRDVDNEGRWFIKEDSYEKVTAGKGSVIFIADVVATGVTLDHALMRLTKIIKQNKGSIRYVIFFAIGCHKAEKILQKYHEIWTHTFSDYEGTDLIYVEGKFHLADSKTPVETKIQGTDLMKYESFMSPELIKSEQAHLLYALERCVIYDAGSRAFEVSKHIEDVIEYWQENLERANEGLNSESLLKERYPEASEALKNKARKQDLKKLCLNHIKNLENLLS